MNDVEKNTEELIWKLAIQNALTHEGKAQTEPIVSRVLGERQDLRSKADELRKLVKKIVNQVNALSLSEQKKMADERWPDLLVKEKAKPEEKKLPPLQNVERHEFIHLRFAPNPDGALHLGGSRAAILCDEYVKMYKGVFTLRFDDSDPRTKSPIPEAYDWIKEDLAWLGVKWHRTFHQSDPDRMEAYYKVAKEILEKGHAYICKCPIEEFRKLLIAKKPCPDRELPPEDQLERWEHMLDGTYGERDVIARLKTDLNHPNPAIRDWPIMRVIDTRKYPHPLTGDRFRVWPLFAFCCGVDDHDTKISHVLRGKEHIPNMVRDQYLYRYMNWELSDMIHYGRLKITGTILSKSKIRAGVAKGEFTGWDDVRLGTLRAFAKRGILPETVRQLILDFGIKSADATVSWVNLYSINRKLLDNKANRYFFVSNPMKLVVDKLDKVYVCNQPLHPDYPERGSRTFEVRPNGGKATLLVSKDDFSIFNENKFVRLMGLFNIEVEKAAEDAVHAVFHSEQYMDAKKLNAPLVHWLLSEGGIKTKIIMPDNTTKSGLSEASCSKLRRNDIPQFERFGFVRIDEVNNSITAYYAHK